MGKTNAAIDSRNTYEYFPLHVNMKVFICLVLLGVAFVAARPQDVVAPAAESEVPAPVQPEVHAADIEAAFAAEVSIEAAIVEEAAADADIVAAIEADIAAKAAIVDVPQVQEPVVEDVVQVLEPVVQASAPVEEVQAAAPVAVVVQTAASVEEVQAAEPVVRASVQLVAVQEVEASVEDVRSFDNNGYSFLYAISDEDSQERDLHFGHKESRSDESDVTRGSYYVNLPDSRRLVVTYYVDEDGFH